MDTSITDLVKDNEVNISNLEEYNIDDIELNDNNDQYTYTSKWIVETIVEKRITFSFKVYNTFNLSFFIYTFIIQ